MELSIDKLVDELLPATIKKDVDNDSKNVGPVYPELLLHKLAQANRFYNSFQRYTRQYIGDSNQRNIVQFSNSQFSLLLAQKIHGWDQLDPDASTVPLATSESGKKAFMKPLGSGSANSLFSWSSGDKYISARKLELQNKVPGSHTNKERASTSTPPPSSRSKPSMSQRITSVVETESTKLIQDRIQIIKAHHIEQASRKIDERKKRDHELYLRRIKMKENEYEEAIKAAIASKETEKKSLGLFGSIFGLNSKSISSSFVLDLNDHSNSTRKFEEGSRKSSVDSYRSKTSRPSTPTPTPKTFVKSPIRSNLATREASPDPPKDNSENMPEDEKEYDPYLPSAYPAASLTNNFSQDLLQL